jgi:HK97 family phage prohead protease
MDLEHRNVGEVRAVGRVLHGTALPFGVKADIGGGLFSESFAPFAFRAALAKGGDVAALADHQPEMLLGRLKSGTLRVSETATGLQYEIDLPATTLGADIQELARRNDLSGVSVGFVVDAQSWPDSKTWRIEAATLHEISILRGSLPAYGDATTVALRSRAAAHGDIARLRRALLAVL